ncbi:hypothetical protein XM38_048070 [Halomicronema hongdechloris C2206]|uniref:DUF202 domain-containing protein n=1 Tax=Halomicronema hongdechloris C2206 TaxID=1641165 RepID=A0A1Z3HU65_9CYAN|nr:DUF202 domain-containing protein [Halomicronema hongdechloris]ASC73833.1 hypothetical protein XM38_048070 [Halomicronema hongdechloris C2206]
MLPEDPSLAPNRYNLNNELAKERNRAAAERTLMAWIRTCLALISFGFGIDQLVAVLGRTQISQASHPSPMARLLGLCFIGLGTFAMVAAILEHRQVLRLIRRDDYLYRPGRSISLTVATALTLLGVASFLGILISALTR